MPSAQSTARGRGLVPHHHSLGTSTASGCHTHKQLPTQPVGHSAPIMESQNKFSFLFIELGNGRGWLWEGDARPFYTKRKNTKQNKKTNCFSTCRSLPKGSDKSRALTHAEPAGSFPTRALPASDHLAPADYGQGPISNDERRSPTCSRRRPAIPGNGKRGNVPAAAPAAGAAQEAPAAPSSGGARTHRRPRASQAPHRAGSRQRPCQRAPGGSIPAALL